MKKQLLFILSLLFTITASSYNSIDTTKYVWWVSMDSMHNRFIPKNPALKMSEEERTAKYNELKAKDSIKISNGQIIKFHKTYPNLVTVDAEVYTNRDREGKLTFTGIDGVVFTKEITSKSYNECGLMFTQDMLKYYYRLNPESWDYIDMINPEKIWGKELPQYDKMTIPNKRECELTFGKNIIVYDKEINGDYVEYEFYHGWPRPWEKYRGSEYKFTGYYEPCSIRKTYDDCTLTFINWQRVTIMYKNGDIYEGQISHVWNDSILKVNDDDDDCSRSQKIYKYIADSKKLSDVVSSFYYGTFTEKNGNIKLYRYNEYDEVESIIFTEKEKERIKKEKERAEAIIKQKEQFVKTYGQKLVNIAYNAKSLKDFIQVGMPTDIIKYFYKAGRCSIELRLKHKENYYESYDVYYRNQLGERVLGAHIWTKNDRITSIHFYD